MLSSRHGSTKRRHHEKAAAAGEVDAIPDNFGNPGPGEKPGAEDKGKDLKKVAKLKEKEVVEKAKKLHRSSRVRFRVWVRLADRCNCELVRWR